MLLSVFHIEEEVVLHFDAYVLFCRITVVVIFDVRWSE